MSSSSSHPSGPSAEPKAPCELLVEVTVFTPTASAAEAVAEAFRSAAAAAVALDAVKSFPPPVREFFSSLASRIRASPSDAAAAVTVAAPAEPPRAFTSFAELAATVAAGRLQDAEAAAPAEARALSIRSAATEQQPTGGHHGGGLEAARERASIVAAEAASAQLRELRLEPRSLPEAGQPGAQPGAQPRFLPSAGDITISDNFTAADVAPITIPARSAYTLRGLCQPHPCTIDAGGLSTSLFTVGDFATLTLINVAVFNGRSSKGGAVIHAGYGSVVRLSGSVFINNEAVGENGGVVFSQGGSCLVDTCTFSSNGADLGGGAIYIADVSSSPPATGPFTTPLSSASASLSISSSSFDSNSARDGSGGAVLVESVSLGALVITSSDFTDNRAFKSGGAVAVRSRAVQVSASRFAGNRAAGPFPYAGALAATPPSGGTLSISSCVFDRNAVVTETSIAPLLSVRAGRRRVCRSSKQGGTPLESQGCYSQSRLD